MLEHLSRKSDTGNKEEISKNYATAELSGIHTVGPELWRFWLLSFYAVQAAGFAAAS